MVQSRYTSGSLNDAINGQSGKLLYSWVNKQLDHNQNPSPILLKRTMSPLKNFPIMLILHLWRNSLAPTRGRELDLCHVHTTPWTHLRLVPSQTSGCHANQRHWGKPLQFLVNIQAINWCVMLILHLWRTSALFLVKLQVVMPINGIEATLAVSSKLTKQLRSLNKHSDAGLTSTKLQSPNKHADAQLPSNQILSSDS